MLLLLQAAAPAAETVVEDGFSKLQVFLQQLIDWGSKCRWSYHQRCADFHSRTFPDIFP